MRSRLMSILFLVIAAACGASPTGEPALETEADEPLPPCETREGEVRVQSDRDAASLRNVCEIRGAIFVAFGSTTTLRWPRLVRIEGTLFVGQNDALEVVELPALTTVTGGFSFTDNLALARIDLTALTDGGTGFYVGDNAALAELDLPIANVPQDSGFILDNASLERLSLPRLPGVGYDLQIAGNGRLVDVVLTTLADVEQGLTLEGTGAVVLGFPALTRVGGNLSVRDNVLLQRLEAPLLLTEGGSRVDVVGNPALEACVGDALAGTFDCRP